MQVGISLQTDNHASTSPLKFFTGRMPFLPPNQQRQSTEGNIRVLEHLKKYQTRIFLLYDNAEGSSHAEKQLVFSAISTEL